MATVLDYLLDNPVVIVLLMVGSGMLLWRARRRSIRVPAAALLIGSTALLIWKVAHANILYHLSKNAVLVLFLLVGGGMLLGHIKIKGVSLGAAAVLFCGIALAAWGASASTPIEVHKDLGALGLAIFTFAIGIQSGPNFFHVIRTAGGPLAILLGILGVAALAAVGAGRLLGLKAAMIAGAFAGAVTNTPALAAAGNAAAMAGDKAGPGDATVAYAVTYLYGVIGMLFFCLLSLRYRRSDKDTPSPLINRTIRVEREDGPLLGNIVETISGQLRFSRLRRGEKGPITRPKNDDRLQKNDLITVVGTQDAVNQAIKAVGHGSSHSLIEDRKYLDFRRIRSWPAVPSVSWTSTAVSGQRSRGYAAATSIWWAPRIWCFSRETGCASSARPDA